MVENFTVELVPHTLEEKCRGVTVTKSLNQSQVFTLTMDSRRLQGYCYQDRFLPLSGVSKELVAEIQTKINHLNGFDAGNGPEPVPMNGVGRTAQEQRQYNECDLDEEIE